MAVSSPSGPVVPPCTDLSGSISSVAAGTYCVTGDIIIPAGSVLVVPPGTEFIFMGRYHFGRDPALPDDASAISGGLTAIGTAEQPIIFRGRDAQTGWYGITISHAPDVVRLEHVTIRDTYKDDPNPTSRIWRRGGGLSSYVNVAGTLIRHCAFINNRAWMVAGALDVNSNWDGHQTNPVEVTDTLFEDNTCECGIYVGSANDKCGGGAIRFSHVAGPVTVARNTFRNNRALNTVGIPAYGGAFGAFDSGIPLGPGNRFENNAAADADGAISCAGQAVLGVNFTRVDSTNVFTGNTPDNGCGL
ncbi:MAG: hypothetical protein HY904_24945 [Deltaproteobacteria bacterium]|nr:hypothetical protein [Deltaproteobacteria bacterium]